MRFLNEYILLPILPIFVVVCGVYFCVILKLYSPRVQTGLFLSVFKRKKSGGISPFAALTVALAGTLGVGNITGVAIAITLGGAGAIFWMWVSAIFSASLKYAEVYLAVKYRKVSDKGYVGGPMYYISQGMNAPKLSRIFCIICLACSLISGPSIQVNSAACIMYDTYGVPRFVTGAAIGIICLITVMGGLRSVSALSEKLIPIVTGSFLLLSAIVIFSRADMIPSVMSGILKDAFDIKSIFAGAGGYGVGACIKHGMAKGVLSHEAGSGTSSISHAGADSVSPSSQGALGMIEVIVDTLIMCTASAFVILLSGAEGGMDGTKTVCEAYSVFFPSIGKHFITLSTVFFAFATILCWSYYGTVCVEYLCRNKFVKKIYIFAYCTAVAVGAVTSPDIAWQLTDLFTCIMTFLNTGCLLVMSRKIKAMPTE